MKTLPCKTSYSEFLLRPDPWLPNKIYRYFREDGQIRKKITYQKNRYSGVSEYSYNNKGLLSQVLMKDKNEFVTQHEKYEYDSHTNFTHIKIVTPTYTITENYEINLFGEVISMKETTDYKDFMVTRSANYIYDEENRLIIEKMYQHGPKRRVNYHTMKFEYDNNDSSSYKVTKQYNDTTIIQIFQKNLLKEEISYINDIETENKKFDYDEFNNLTTLVTKNSVITNKMTYNEQGNYVECKTYRNGKLFEHEKCAYIK